MAQPDIPGAGLAENESNKDKWEAPVPQVDQTLLPRLFSILYSAQQPGSLDDAPSAPPFQTAESAGKGIGTIATRGIDRGDLLISEPPLVVWPQDVKSEAARTSIDRLSPPAREAFWALGNAKPDTALDEVLAIRATNGFAVELPPLGEPEGTTPEVVSMIFPRIARINHSCLPVADQAMNWSTLRMEVWAMAPIDTGSEITIEYSAAMVQKTRAERQRHLRDTFAFDCVCTLCTSPAAEAEASDVRRREIDSLVKELARAEGGKEERGRKMKMLERIADLLEEEGYKGMAEFDEPSVSQAFAMYLQQRARLKGALRSGEENDKCDAKC